MNHPGDGFPDEGGDAAGDFRAAGVHRLCVDGRRDRPCRGARCGADGPEAAGPSGAGIAGCAGLLPRLARTRVSLPCRPGRASAMGPGSGMDGSRRARVFRVMLA
jgi:hypothetical protein